MKRLLVNSYVFVGHYDFRGHIKEPRKQLKKDDLSESFQLFLYVPWVLKEEGDQEDGGEGEEVGQGPDQQLL